MSNSTVTGWTNPYLNDPIPCLFVYADCMDPLSDLLQGVRARTAAFCRTIWDPPWALLIADEAALALVTALRGHVWIVPDGADPVLIRTGDVAIAKGPRLYTIGDDPGTVPEIIVKPGNRLTDTTGTDITDAFTLGPRTTGSSLAGSTIVASGTYQIDNDVTGRLLKALPDVVVVSSENSQNEIIDLLAKEVGTAGPGQQVVLDRLLDIALVATLRAWFARSDTEAPGWYRAQYDELVGPALRAIHEDPARRWTVAGLAERAGGSRSALARRFTALVGEPPLTYLTGWRMALAADLLQASDLTIEAIAHRVGYANAFALSVAFTRTRGLSPSRYRAGARKGVPRIPESPPTATNTC